MEMLDVAASMVELIGAALAGTLLGSFYFGGLWFTVRHAAQWRNPGLGVAASLFLRLVLVALGFYWLADGHWQRYAAAAAGLLAARWVWIRRIEPGRGSRCN